ncbi:hypothetical protein BC830DRAFT_1165872 [Chytriomyces sp. MP71]|nr:hypothetical protein BC830DRAFT_1165872 [Chytriomyces sp. MP71]
MVLVQSTVDSNFTWPTIVFVGPGGGIGGVFGDGSGLTDRAHMLDFILAWTLVAFALLFGAAGIVAFATALRKRASLAVALLLLLAIAGFGLATGLVGGALMGYFIGSIYQIGGFVMPLWVPLGWALVQVLVAAISSYAEIGLNAL